MSLNSVRETQVFNYSFTVYSSSEVHSERRRNNVTVCQISTGRPEVTIRM